MLHGATWRPLEGRTFRTNLLGHRRTASSACVTVTFSLLFAAAARSSVFTYSLDHVHGHRSNNKHLLAGYHLRPIHLMSGILQCYPTLCRESIGGTEPFRSVELKKKRRINGAGASKGGSANVRRLGRVKRCIECTSSSFPSILSFSNIPAKDLVLVNFGKI